ncbi:type I-Fv CRISPR-associated protein Cas5fv [Moraxella sp. ZJ142]|uniref:type I-Fv CRISPR-associated protein Cas5fv n=1 Tax=Moraxella marmotae TaxID=3344520 RepID=UPI0035D40F6D
MSALKKEGNYIKREVTIDTVMGILNRLIGDQAKLYQARAREDYFFADIEPKVSFEDKPLVRSQEIVRLQNLTGATDKNLFTGMIKANHPFLKSKWSQAFWNILALDVPELLAFILGDGDAVNRVEQNITLDPLVLTSRLEEIAKIKSFEPTEDSEKASELLSQKFENYKPYDSKDKQRVLPLYCSALYLQLSHLENEHDLSAIKAPRGGIRGISNNTITPRDFMQQFTTGGAKLVYGGPYLKESFVAGEGKVREVLDKCSGELLINIDVDDKKAEQIKQMIENAGVGCFYVGKKGLAYVASIV